MTTKKQVQANRTNAEKSTGPRTSNGKSISSQNSRKHGILSKQKVLPDEDPREFEELSSELQQFFNPFGKLEEELVKRIIIELWGLRRVDRIEASILERNIFLERADRAEDKARDFVKFDGPTIEELVQNISNPREIITNEEEHQNAKKEAEDAKTKAKYEVQGIGQAFLRDVKDNDALGKLSRYGSTKQRNLYRAIHELERLQAKRVIEPVTPQITLDMDLNVSEEAST